MTQATLAVAGKEEVKRLVGLAMRLGSPDKYAGKRKKSRLKATIWMEALLNVASEDAIQVSTHDISLGGVSFWLRKKASPGDEVYVRDCSDSKRHPWLKVRITHCVVGLKGFLVGGEFECDK